MLPIIKQSVLSIKMRINLLLKGVVLATTLAIAPFKAYSMPQEFEGETGQLGQIGDFRQAMQMGAFFGTVRAFCMIYNEGFIHPEEGPVTEVQLNSFTRSLIEDAGSEFDEDTIQYQKAGINMAIKQCNKRLGLNLEYR